MNSLVGFLEVVQLFDVGSENYGVQAKTEKNNNEMILQFGTSKQRIVKRIGIKIFSRNIKYYWGLVVRALGNKIQIY